MVIELLTNDRHCGQSRVSKFGRRQASAIARQTRASRTARPAPEETTADFHPPRPSNRPPQRPDEFLRIKAIISASLRSRYFGFNRRRCTGCARSFRRGAQRCGLPSQIRRRDVAIMEANIRCGMEQRIAPDFLAGEIRGSRPGVLLNGCVRPVRQRCPGKAQGADISLVVFASSNQTSRAPFPCRRVPSR